MSVYSGFAKRNQEDAYWKAIEQLIDVLTLRIQTQLAGKPINDVYWSKRFLKIYKFMRELEKHKYQPPKISGLCTDLVNQLKTEASQMTKSFETEVSEVKSVKARTPKPIFIYKDVTEGPGGSTDDEQNINHRAMSLSTKKRHRFKLHNRGLQTAARPRIITQTPNVLFPGPGGAKSSTRSPRKPKGSPRARGRTLPII